MRPLKCQRRSFDTNLFLLATLFQHARAVMQCTCGRSGIEIQLLQKSLSFNRFQTLFSESARFIKLDALYAEGKPGEGNL